MIDSAFWVYLKLSFLYFYKYRNDVQKNLLKYWKDAQPVATSLQNFIGHSTAAVVIALRRPATRAPPMLLTPTLLPPLRMTVWWRSKALHRAKPRRQFLGLERWKIDGTETWRKGLGTLPQIFVPVHAPVFLWRFCTAALTPELQSLQSVLVLAACCLRLPFRRVGSRRQYLNNDSVEHQNWYQREPALVLRTPSFIASSVSADLPSRSRWTSNRICRPTRRDHPYGQSRADRP